MTLEELKRANWSKLDKGVEYINLKDGNSSSNDSIHFALTGLWGNGKKLEETYSLIQPVLHSILTSMLQEKLPKSKHGYLKVDFSEMTQPDAPTAQVYLSDNIDSLELKKGLQMIRSVKGVIEVTYMSPETAKKIYLGEENENWDKVLDSNPLPASIEIKFDNQLIQPENYAMIQNKIKDEIPEVTEVKFPSQALFGIDQQQYYILEYFQ